MIVLASKKFEPTRKAFKTTTFGLVKLAMFRDLLSLILANGRQKLVSSGDVDCVDSAEERLNRYNCYSPSIFVADTIPSQGTAKQIVHVPDTTDIVCVTVKISRTYHDNKFQSIPPRGIQLYQVPPISTCADDRR